MAIFSRRDIQTALNSLRGRLTAAQLEELVRRLNGEAQTSLSTEWEAILLYAFGQCGRIEYEKDFGGKRKPDLFFQFGQSGRHEFLADITTVSDIAAHDENPYDVFSDTVHAFLQKKGHTAAGINLSVHDKQVGNYGNSKIHLLLPEKGKMYQFVKDELGQFLMGIIKEPSKAAQLSYDKNGVSFNITYDAQEKKYSGGRHLVYTVPYSRQRNPLANSLKSKSKQLGQSGYQGLSGLIVCDGGCEALKERSKINGAYGCHEIIGDVFKNHSSIAFVLVLQLIENFRNNIHHSIHITPKIYWNPAQTKAHIQELGIAIERMLKSLPSPEAAPKNAINWLKSQKNIGRPLSKISMANNSIKISARALTELLAGKVELKKFLEEHNLKPIQDGQRAFPFFELQIQQGNTLKNAFVEQEVHADDDLIVLEYAGPDPAISPYRVPR